MSFIERRARTRSVIHSQALKVLHHGFADHLKLNWKGFPMRLRCDKTRMFVVNGYWVEEIDSKDVLVRGHGWRADIAISRLKFFGKISPKSADIFFGEKRNLL